MRGHKQEDHARTVASSTSHSRSPPAALNPSPLLVSKYESVASHLRPALLRLRCLPPNSKPAVIILGGSFNPIHSGHMAMMSAAQQYLKSLHPPVVTVVALLALATDEWLQGKDMPPDECMPFEDRLRLCLAAASTSDIVVPVPYPAGNQFAELRRTHAMLAAASGCSSLMSFSLMGADTLQRLRSATSVPIIAFVRTDFPFDFEAARRSNPHLHVISYLPDHLIGLSSTKCRAQMNSGAWDDLVDGDLLPLAVVDMLRSRQQQQQQKQQQKQQQQHPPSMPQRTRAPLLGSRRVERDSFPGLFPKTAGRVVRRVMALCGVGAAAAIDASDDSYECCDDVQSPH